MASQNVLDICSTCLLFCVARARAENFELEPEPNFWIGPSPAPTVVLRRKKTMSIKSVFTKIVEHWIYEGWQIFYFLFLNFTAHAVNKLFNFALEYLARAGSGTSKKTGESADQKKAWLQKIGYRILASLRFVHAA